MSEIVIKRHSEIVRTPRLLQIESMFELPPSERSEVEWRPNLQLPETWAIGVVVGPSGVGKTTLVEEMFPKHLARRWKWDKKKSIVDSFPAALGIKEIVNLLNSVGFSTPHAWVRSFQVLSSGEQYRVNVARTLSEMSDLSVIDEFSSVVDRSVAQIASAAIQKTVRRRKQKMIAVSCHYDILDWLEPDWVYEPHTNEMQIGRHLWRRPEIKIEVRRVHSSAWQIFGRFHYLDTAINRSALCFVAFIDNAPAAFCAVISFPHAHRPGWRFHRLVCLPDYQGIGLGVRFADLVASIFAATSKPVFRTLAHPAVIHACLKSPVWETRRAPGRTQYVGQTSSLKSFRATVATKRMTAGFEYIGPAMQRDQAFALLGR